MCYVNKEIEYEFMPCLIYFICVFRLTMSGIVPRPLSYELTYCTDSDILYTYTAIYAY